MQLATCISGKSWEVALAVEPSPSVRRRRLGHELRELRERAGFTLDDAAAQLEVSAAKISRIETAKVGVRSRDVEDLLDLYGLRDAQQRSDLLTLTRDSRQHAWWEPFSNAMPPGEDLAIGLEGEAVSIRMFSPHFIEDLFQTEEYARELLIASYRTESPEQVDLRVKLRMARQRILDQNDGLEVRAVLDESLLHRPVGGHEILRQQVSRLIQIAQFPNVSIRVIPLSVGAHPGGDGSFRIVDLSPPNPSIVHIGYLTGATFIEGDDRVKLYSDIFTHLEYASMTREQSLDLLMRLSGPQ